MKLGIIGAGAVGAATAMAVLNGSKARRMVIVNRHRERARAMAQDMSYGAPLCPTIEISEGGYDALADAALLILTAGINEQAGGATDRNDPAGRLRLLKENVKIFAEIVPEVVQAAPNAPILVLTDPPDPLVDVARHYAGHDLVFATGTALDSLRFRTHLGQHLSVNPASIQADVVGEHGTSSVFLWSSARVGGEPIQELLARRKIAFDEFRKRLETEVRQANISIIEGIGASQYGVGIVAARMAEAVLKDESAVFPASAHNARYSTAISLPSVIGRKGVSDVLMPAMTPEESSALERSAEIIRHAFEKCMP